MLDEENHPVPYATIFVRELGTGTAASDKGIYFLTIAPGIYHFVVSSVGYQSESFQVTITDKALTRNVTLRTSSTELNELIVKAKRRDPAFEIIQKAIDRKEKNLTQIKSYQTNIYVRALEDVDKKKQPIESTAPVEVSPKGPPIDPSAEAKRKDEARLLQLNLLEMQLVLHYEYPDRYKEQRTAYKLHGRKEGLFIPVFSQADFNFYHNLVDLKGISEIPMISPLSRTAILSYKYKLEEVLKEPSGVVYKIKVTPRKTGDATAKGYVFINDSTWNINRLELSLEKGALKFYDLFTIRQTYEEVAKDLWIPARQEFIYETKTAKSIFKGSTWLVYSEFQKDVEFPPHFFGNEVSIITKDAFKKDSVYWNRNRPEPLTPQQQKMVNYRDSVEAVRNSKKYQDSVDARFNKVTFGEVIYHGVGFQNGAKKRNVHFASLLNFIDFSVVGGFRLGPYASYFRRYENDRMLWLGGSTKYGIKNRDWQGNVNTWWRYDPYHLGDMGALVGRSFYSIFPTDAYLNQLKVSNYILHEHVELFYRRELVNGLYLRIQGTFSNRRSIDDLNTSSIIDEVYDQGEPLVFEDYKALITYVLVSYTPGQQFMSEPTRKVVLGSKYPTFSVQHRKGWTAVLGSTVDFDYTEYSIEQNLLLGTLGNSRYTLTAGKFPNTRDLRFIDVKRFRQSDPVLYSDGLRSFQLLDTSLTTTNWFWEAHYIHHFNGAMINNLPLIKKTKLRTVAGAGAMWIYENKYRHQELFAGIERIFKLGPRRRLRIGAYGVVGQSNNRPPKTDFKISFDIIDTWKVDWSY